MENFKARVLAAQNALKAPKGQFNKFGGYKYRSCEDILEAVKPVNAVNGLLLTVSDDVVMVGERIYIKATATIRDTDSEESICNIAWAREPESKKGMDDSQITGTASSYARKYALNGLYCIDDTKDADSNEHAVQTRVEEYKPLHFCAECGEEICNVEYNGKKYSADNIAANAVKKYGKELCWDCMKAAKANA